MSTNLERKRIEVEISKVRSARHELEMKIMEREEDIARIQDHIQIQLKRESELEQKLKEMSGDK